MDGWDGRMREDVAKKDKEDKYSDDQIKRAGSRDPKIRERGGERDIRLWYIAVVKGASERESVDTYRGKSETRRERVCGVYKRRDVFTRNDERQKSTERAVSLIRRYERYDGGGSSARRKEKGIWREGRRKMYEEIRRRI